MRTRTRHVQSKKEGSFGNVNLALIDTYIQTMALSLPVNLYLLTLVFTAECQHGRADSAKQLDV